jgi:tRNA G10  N-methylase Trm11
MNLTEAPEFAGLVTFEGNRREPIHGWWWYKEGFSRALVDKLLDHMQMKEGLVLDPYCGSGTTLLACKQRNVASVGFEINPLFVLVSRVKTRDYDLDELAKFAKEARSWKFQKPAEMPKDPYLKKAFSKWALQDIVWLRSMVSSVREESAREFLYLALIEAAMRGSWTVKEGAIVKIRKRQVAPVGKLFKNNVERWVKDLKKTKLPRVSCGVYAGDARRLPLGSGSIDAIITSPPYLGITDYQTAFRLELNLFFGLPPTWRPASIAIEPGQLRKLEAAIPGFSDMPAEAQEYFGSMIDAFGEMHRVLKKGGKAAIVMGGGCFPDRAIQADACCASIAETVGFSVPSVMVARRLWCTRARTIKVGQLRESVLMLEKP